MCGIGVLLCLKSVGRLRMLGTKSAACLQLRGFAAIITPIIVVVNVVMMMQMQGSVRAWQRDCNASIMAVACIYTVFSNLISCSCIGSGACCLQQWPECMPEFCRLRDTCRVVRLACGCVLQLTAPCICRLQCDAFSVFACA